METVQLVDATAFLGRAGPMLMRDEARHNLILGIAGTIRDDPRLYPERTFWLVEDGGAVIAAALRTPPHNLVLAAGDEAALETLARSIAELPGVIGAVPEVEQFAGAWTDVHGCRAEVRFEQGIYAADAIVSPARPAAGAARAAVDADRPLLRDWWRAFEQEAHGETEIDEERNRRSLEHRLAALGNGIALWEDGGEPVSLAGFGSPTPNGIRIGPVYTPAEHRGRGYASALTAHVSQAQLDAGRAFCFLYTDLANPTSNKIYVDIGYCRTCDAIQYAFV